MLILPTTGGSTARKSWKLIWLSESATFELSSRQFSDSMETIPLGTSTLKSSQLAYGCWRIGGPGESSEITPEREAAAARAVTTAFEAGYTLFDHADIYCHGEAERIFGKILKTVAGMRERILLASKCGIRKPGDPDPDSPYRYDFSAGQIGRAHV